MSVYALIVAAGRGERLGAGRPKQYQPLGGTPMLRHSLARFAAHSRIDAAQAVIRPQDRALYDEAAADLPLLAPVAGGAERQDSVRAGLESLADIAEDPAHDLVLVHDAARPFVSMDLIDRVIDRLSAAPAVVPVLGVADTLKRGEEGWITETVPRDTLYRAQTPQGFHLGPLLAAHEVPGGTPATDDAALMERLGHPVAMVEGEEDAFKITTTRDMERAAAMIEAGMETRVGIGTDVHRFGDGDHVMLCGVRIPHERGLEGHSDADAGAHAVTDALLGAIGAGDIGQLFPPGDPQWAGAPSSVFLDAARQRVAEAGGEIRHIDLSLICESPKIGPYRAAMIAAVAENLAIAPERVSIKATTTEGLGFTGRGEGIAAEAVATVAVPAGLRRAEAAMTAQAGTA